MYYFYFLVSKVCHRFSACILIIINCTKFYKNKRSISRFLKCICNKLEKLFLKIDNRNR